MMAQTQPITSQNGTPSVQSLTPSVAPPPQSQNAPLTALWPVLPNLLWVVFAFVLFFVLLKKFQQLLTELVFRIQSGAAVRFASVELGPIVVASGRVVSKTEEQIGVRPDEGHTRENERHIYREHSRDIMLVHQLYRSREPGELYDLIVYLIPHKQASLAGVSRVEYFLGSYWGNKIFPSLDRSRGFAIATAAYGPVLCTAEVFFNDDSSIILHRYLDFEMGVYAPARLNG